MRTSPLWAIVVMTFSACDKTTSRSNDSTSPETLPLDSSTPSISTPASADTEAEPNIVVEEQELTGGDPFLRLSKRQVLDLYSDSSCDGLSGATGQIQSQYNRGLRGYVDVPAASTTASDYNSLRVFEADGATQRLANKLFLSQLNVPTRSFASGFPTLNGDSFKDTEDNVLLEYFRLTMDGFIELPAGMSAGDYEFAVIADDGAELTFGNSTEPYLSYPQHTQSRLICGNESVHLAQNETLPLKLSYFQGPRYHIALMLLWRPASAQAEPLCGRSGNDRWFNSSQTPSVPKADYLALESRGWSVVPAPAFRIPDDEIANPCQSDYVKEIFETCANGACLGVGI